MDRKTMMMIAVVLVMVAVSYFLIVRPQRKQQKETKNMRDSLTVGDDILTVGGIFGKVTKVRGDTITMRVTGSNTKIKLMSWGVSGILASSAKKEEKEVEKKSAKKAEESATMPRPKRMKRKQDNNED
jgi:preprotein translocase subunit YajC